MSNQSVPLYSFKTLIKLPQCKHTRYHAEISGPKMQKYDVSIGELNPKRLKGRKVSNDYLEQ